MDVSSIEYSLWNYDPCNNKKTSDKCLMHFKIQWEIQQKFKVQETYTKITFPWTVSTACTIHP